MISFDILTLFPEMFPGVLEKSILGRAVSKELISFNYVNIRDFSSDKHKRVDDYPYGGGCGMVMQPQPIFDAYNSVLKSDNKKPLTIFLSPRGRQFNQEIAKELSKEEHIVLICGHYEGVDQRIIDEICDYELSVGDFVLTGGELGAMIVCDAVSRLVPGVLAEEQGFIGESHYNGLLEYPQYTRPPVWNDRKVPDVLLSGKQIEIDKWRKEQSLALTEISRPDLYDKQDEPSFYHRTDKACSFTLLSYCANQKDREEVYKIRRKLSRKFKSKGFLFDEISKVIDSKDELSSIESEKPLVVVSFDEIIDIKTTASIIGNVKNTDSIYPYFICYNSENICEELLAFLSITKTVKKYEKKSCNFK